MITFGIFFDQCSRKDIESKTKLKLLNTWPKKAYKTYQSYLTAVYYILLNIRIAFDLDMSCRLFVPAISPRNYNFFSHLNLPIFNEI